MSTLYNAPVVCSACGATLYIEVGDSLNANRMPVARERVLARSLFTEECTCGRRITAIHPVLYVDFERGLWVQVASEENRPAFLALEAEALRAYQAAFDTEAGPKFIGALGAMVRPRVVFGYEELREKVVCADAGLDDVLIEALKFELLIARPDLLTEGVEVLILSECDDEALTFALYTAAQVFGQLTVSRSAYASIVRRKEAVMTAYPRLFAGSYVNIARYRFGAEDVADEVVDGT